ncbi:MAG TPA: hypothetical protein VF388_06525, partial [Lacunisphaera sp.]
MVGSKEMKSQAGGAEHRMDDAQRANPARDRAAGRFDKGGVLEKVHGFGAGRKNREIGNAGSGDFRFPTIDFQFSRGA